MAQVAEPTSIATAGGASAVAVPPPASNGKSMVSRGGGRAPGESRWVAIIFLLPAVVLLVALLVYPLFWSLVRSLYTDGPAGVFGKFTWLGNYKAIFTDNQAFRAVKNNVIWVLVAPAVLTMLGLIFAVLIE